MAENDNILSAVDTEPDVETVMNVIVDYKDIKSEIDDLREIIVALDTAFELGDDCINPITMDIVTDNEYDAYKRRINQIDPAWKELILVTASKAKIKGGKVIHNPPMTSINKCNGTQKEKEDILLKFFENYYREFCNSKGLKNVIEDGETFIMSFKHDGLALSCEYVDGKLDKVGLRSKSGMDGIDVTDKAKYIAGIPQTLKDPETCKVRGEVETSIPDFKRSSKELGAKAKANPRAHTAGSMNQKTAEKMRTRGLRFTAYNVVDFKNPPYKTEIERAKWTSKQGFHFVKTIPFSYAMLKTFEKEHRLLKFMVDGAVISVNNLDKQILLGTSGNKKTGNPKGKIAWKFADEVKTAIVKNIVWQTGRTGAATPVLIFDGLDLEGTTVTRCTAHNWGLVKNKRIGIGCQIEVIKSGKIIPKIKSVISSKSDAIMPIECPSCKGSLEEIDGTNGTISLVCNSLNCPAQKVKNLNHFLKRLGVKGIAESTITKLINKGMITSPSDFYSLSYGRLVSEGFTKRTAALIVARICMVPNAEDEKDSAKLITQASDNWSKKLNIPLATFIASLGMDGAGREVGRLLADKYGDIYKIQKLSVEELESIDGIGSVIANSVNKFFKNNDREIHTLLQFINPIIPKTKKGKLTGKTFVLSGKFEDGKKTLQALIENNGGKIKSSVGKSLDYLVAGEGSGSKTDKAKKYGITILTAEELEKLV